MRIATWNINSVRLRLPLLLRLIDEARPDVVCLQETKAMDEVFPRAALEARGYGHIHIAGMKSYNGVAIVSRLPLEAHCVHHRCGREDCRHVSATLPGEIELHCLYVPAGGDVPDPALNPKFAHKLDFLDELAGWFPAERVGADRRMVLVGDLNVAPLETDVWSHKQLLTVVSHTPIEVEKFGRLQDSIGWVDAMRRFVPPEERLYTWWSYRNQDWRRSDRGRRLDHAWVTPALADRLVGIEVLKDARDWVPGSDHVPVVLELRD